MLVELRELSKSFEDRVLFAGMGHSFVSGCVNVILGESGSGKTTLLNIVGLFEPPDAGEVLYDGVVVSGKNPRETRKIIRSNVGYVYQDIRLFEDLSVTENIELALRFSDVPRSRWKKRSDTLLGLVGLEGFQGKLTRKLSGGEKQRIAIARALASNKKLLLADEPTGALDEENTRIIIDLIKRVNREEGCTIIMVTHSMQVAQEFPHRYWLRNGFLYADGVSQ